MKFLINLIITGIIVYVLSKLLEPHVLINSFGTAIIFALVLSFLNSIVEPLLILLTLPITILTLGLFLLIINVLIIMLADKFVTGIAIDGFFWTCIFALLLSFSSSILNKPEKRTE